MAIVVREWIKQTVMVPDSASVPEAHE